MKLPPARLGAVSAVAALVLAAGSSQGPAGAQPADPAVAERCLSAGGPVLPADWSDRRKIVHAAVCEWAKFGFPTVEIRPVRDRAGAAALPAVLGLDPALARAASPARPGYEATVPAVEVQLRFGRGENDASVGPLIEAYWRQVRPAYADDMRRMRALVDQAPGGGAMFHPAWRLPWSAAFVSWVYAQAAPPGFTGSASHVLYLKSALAARPDAVRPASMRRFLPGDLICAPRGARTEVPEAVGEAGFLAALATSPGHFDAHCDVVVRVNRDSLVSIGGNVKNSVVATVTPLKDGRPIRTDVKPWSAALVLAEPYDRCARMESVALPGWRGPAAEAGRRQALARTRCDGPLA